MRQLPADRSIKETQQRQQQSEKSHSLSSITASSEYSTLDESSHDTTPPTSSPHSERGYFPLPEETKPKPGKIENVATGAVRNYSRNQLSLSPMAHDLPYERIVEKLTNASNTNSQMPFKLDDWKRPTVARRKKFSTTQLPEPAGSIEPITKSAKNPNSSFSEPQRPASLPRSMSTPVLQDLSFLAPQNHQPSQKDRGTFDEDDNKTTKPFIKSPPSQSSPLRPLSGNQQVRDTRLSFPVRRAARNLVSPTNQVLDIHPVAKVLVVCCSCRYFHDLPSRVYECMANPDNVVTDSDLGMSGVISTAVTCPWCGHGMTKSCCRGYAAVVYLRERLH